MGGLPPKATKSLRMADLASFLWETSLPAHKIYTLLMEGAFDLPRRALGKEVGGGYAYMPVISLSLIHKASSYTLYLYQVDTCLRIVPVSQCVIYLG